MKNRTCVLTLAMSVALALTACGHDRDTGTDNASPEAAGTSNSQGLFSGLAKQGLERALRKIRESNIPVGGGESNIKTSGSGEDTSALPLAEISPAGDFLVDGHTVSVDAAQRELLLGHRRNLLAIIEGGISVGLEGAQLGVNATGNAVAQSLNGDANGFEDRMRAEAQKLERLASGLCDLLQPVLESQQALAASLPEFRPYAKLEPSDIENCRNRRSGALDTDAGDPPASDAPSATAAATP